MIVDIYYDGDCPYCSNFVAYSRLQKNCEPRLHNLRDAPEAVARFRQMGLDVNQGMVVQIGESIHYGSDAVYILGKLSARNTVISKLYYVLFSHQKITKALYPAMRAGRNATLFLLGRKKI